MFISKNILMNIVILLIIISSQFFTGCSLTDDEDEEIVPPKWTIMVYGDGDNNLEEYLLGDINEMKNGYINNQGINLIVLVDRIPSFSNDSTVLGDDFTDTRLYSISEGTATRIDGGDQFPEITVNSDDYEANMGDAETLKKFVQFCKDNYETDHYALILWNHGGGARGTNITKSDGYDYKAVCWDETSDGDSLYTAEITDVLTASESVDLLGFDACLMGSVEVAYQYRPDNGGFHADVMVASPHLEWGFGWKYDEILGRISIQGGNNGTDDVVVGGYELFHDPSDMTALELAGIIVEEQYDSTLSQSGETLSSYDLSKVTAVKTAVDTLATSLYDENEKDDFEDIRGSDEDPDIDPNIMHYFDASYTSAGKYVEWIASPFFDLYDLSEATSISSNFSSTVNDNAAALMSAVDDMIVHSFAGPDFSGFVNGKNGIHIFFPNGDWEEDEGIHWAYQWWYNAIEISHPITGDGYGKLSWCDSGATSDDGEIDNWFEMLDSWFDELTDLNSYTP